jgi:hypothetical protein
LLQLFGPELKRNKAWLPGLEMMKKKLIFLSLLAQNNPQQHPHPSLFKRKLQFTQKALSALPDCWLLLLFTVLSFVPAHGQ